MTAHDDIRATFETFARAWDAHDVGAMADCWLPEGNAIDIWGKYALGREGVIELLGDEHRTPMRESRYQLLRIEIRELSDESAVVECDARIDDALTPNGKKYPLPHKLSAVVVRRGGAWKFLSVHPSFA